MYKHAPTYQATYEDFIAKSFCQQRNIVCEAFACVDTDKIKVWVTFPDGRDFLRDKEYDKEDSDYAVYESYRSVSAKIFKKENDEQSI